MIKVKIAPLIESAKANFWFVPSIMIMVTVLMAVLTVWIDVNTMWDAKQYIPMIYSANVDAMRSLLGIIAGSMITVTSIAFSITIVSLTMASSQFGPRLMRNFMKDRFTQIVLGIFTSNFLYCILIFCAISLNEPYQFAPGVSLIWALLMTCISVGFLIHFIHHVAKSIQADAVVDDVFKDLQQNIDKYFPSYASDKAWRPQLTTRDLNADGYSHEYVLRSSTAGYVQLIDIDKLIKILAAYELRLCLHFSAGDYVHKGSAFAHLYALDSNVDTDTLNIEAQFVLGAKRTPVQDPEFAIHQLVEIALRALSPGINDPFTAIVCIDKLASILCDLTTRQFPSVEKKDADGIVRIHCKSLCFRDMGRAAFDQIRQNAHDNTAVTIRLLASLNEIAIQACSQQQYEFIVQQLSMIEQQQALRTITIQDQQDIDSYIIDIKAYLERD